MPVLHNRISNDALKAKMLAESEPRTTISFYKYFHIADPKATRDALYQLFTALNVFGRVYLATPATKRQANQIFKEQNFAVNLCRYTLKYFLFNHYRDGGAMRDRTADLLRAKQALSQLSYSPITCS